MRPVRTETSEPKVVAISVSDIHLSQLAPVARAGESDWFRAMRRPLEELCFLQKALDVPVLLSGDLFHHWRSSPELINFAMNELPFMYAIPGQHDLPYHDFGQVKKSAYWTLEQAGTIQTVTPAGTRVRGLHLFGYPWGVPVTPPTETGGMVIGLVHKYVWLAGDAMTKFSNASEDDAIGYMTSDGRKDETLARYPFQVTLFGDNHITFGATTQDIIETHPFENIPRKKGTGRLTTVWNSGSLMRRNADQVNHKPCVGMVREDGSVVPHYLDTSKDVISTAHIGREQGSEYAEAFAPFLDQLRDLKGTVLDYPEAIRQVIGKCSPNVKKLLLEALDARGD